MVMIAKKHSLSKLNYAERMFFIPILSFKTSKLLNLSVQLRIPV